MVPASERWSPWGVLCLVGEETRDPGVSECVLPTGEQRASLAQTSLENRKRGNSHMCDLG